MSYLDWCSWHGCSHGHCPRGCEHPQPFWAGDRLVCGRCAAVDGELVEMIPCSAETCGE